MFICKLDLKWPTRRLKVQRFLPAFAASTERHLAHRGQVVDDFAQHLQLLANGRQLLGVRRQVVAVAPASFAAEKFIDCLEHTCIDQGNKQ